MLFAVRLQGEGRARSYRVITLRRFGEAFPAEQRDPLAALLQMLFAFGSTEK